MGESRGLDKKFTTPGLHGSCWPGGSQTYSILHSFVCSFVMNYFLLREGCILRELGVTLLFITGGPLITELLVAPCLLSLLLKEWTRHGVRRFRKKRQCSVMII